MQVIGALRKHRAADIAATNISERHPMKEPIKKNVDLGRCGKVMLHVSGNRKRLLLEFETEPEGFDKSGLNAFIDALKDIREKMDR